MSSSHSLTDSPWQPHLTVATVVERDGRFLFVEEMAEGKKVLNQPAGHVEQNESLIAAAVRETIEETGWEVSITHYLGVALYTAPSNGITYCRHTFLAEAITQHTELALDDGIIGPVWLSIQELEARKKDWRSPLLAKTVQQYVDGNIYSLNALYGDA